MSNANNQLDISPSEIRIRIFELEILLAALPLAAKRERAALEDTIRELREQIRNYVF